METSPTIKLIDGPDEILYTVGRDHKLFPSPLHEIIPENKATKFALNLIKKTTKLVKITDQELHSMIDSYASGRSINREDVILYLMLIDLINYNIDEYIDTTHILSEQYSIFSKNEETSEVFHIYETKNAKAKSKFVNAYKVKTESGLINFINQGQFPFDFNFGSNEHGLLMSFHKLNDGKINLKGKPNFIFKFEMLKKLTTIEDAKNYLNELNTFSAWEIYVQDKKGNIVTFNSLTKTLNTSKLENGDFLYFHTDNQKQLLNVKDIKELIHNEFAIEKIIKYKLSKNKLINLNTNTIAKLSDDVEYFTQELLLERLKNKHLILAHEANHGNNKEMLYHQLQMYLCDHDNPKMEFLLYSLYYQDHRNQNELNLIDKKITGLKEHNINKSSYKLLKELITIDLGHKITSQNTVVNLYLQQNKIIRKAIRSQLKINLNKLDIEFPTLDLLYKLKILS